MARRRRIVAAPTTGSADGVSPWSFVGMVLMAAALFLYGASVLVAPWWAVLVLVLVWVALFVLCCRWWTPHPTRLPVVAVGAMALWFVVLVGGGAYLGWSP